MVLASAVVEYVSTAIAGLCRGMVLSLWSLEAIVQFRVYGQLLSVSICLLLVRCVGSDLFEVKVHPSVLLRVASKSLELQEVAVGFLCY